MSEPEQEGRVLAVHVGHSANCSSIGSVVDFLFASAVIGAAVLTAVSVALAARRPEGDGDGDGDGDGEGDGDDKDTGAGQG